MRRPGSVPSCWTRERRMKPWNISKRPFDSIQRTSRRSMPCNAPCGRMAKVERADAAKKRLAEVIRERDEGRSETGGRHRNQQPRRGARKGGRCSRSSGEIPCRGGPAARSCRDAGQSGGCPSEARQLAGRNRANARGTATGSRQHLRSKRRWKMPWRRPRLTASSCRNSDIRCADFTWYSAYARWSRS